MIHSFIPTTVGPSKLDLLLADAPELSDESKTKVIILMDIDRISKLTTGKPMSPKAFYDGYDCPLEYLERVQHDLQVSLNTAEYRARIQGHDF